MWPVESPDEAYRLAVWVFVVLCGLQPTGPLLYLHKKTHQLALRRLGYDSSVTIRTQVFGPFEVCVGGGVLD